MQRPLNELIAKLPPEKFARIKSEAARVVASYAVLNWRTRQAICQRSRPSEPQTLSELLRALNPESAPR